MPEKEQHNILILTGNQLFARTAKIFSIFVEEIGEKNPEMEKWGEKLWSGFILCVLFFSPIYQKIIPPPGGECYSAKYTLLLAFSLCQLPCTQYHNRRLLYCLMSTVYKSWISRVWVQELKSIRRSLYPEKLPGSQYKLKPR